MTNKRYFWLKLDRNFFKRHDIKIIESRQNGKDHILFYLKLLVESIDHEGELRFNETIPYDPEMLATITNTNIDTVKQAIQLFTNLKMMEIFDDGTIYMNEVTKMIGSETASTQRSRKHRESKALQCNNVQQNCNTELDKDKDKDKEKIYKKEKSEYSEDFEKFWSNYPSRGNHTNNKSEAFNQWQARLKQKHTIDQMLTGGINYNQHCTEADKVNTEFVMQASRFLGNKKHFMDYQQLKEVNQNAESNKHKTTYDLIDEGIEELRQQYNT